MEERIKDASPLTVHPFLQARFDELTYAVADVPIQTLRHLPLLEITYALRTNLEVGISTARANLPPQELDDFVRPLQERHANVQRQIANFNADLLGCWTEEIKTVIGKLFTQVDLDSLEQEDRECIICNVSYGSADVTKDIEFPVKLKCPGGHIFGSKCITSWLTEKTTCPYCRFEFQDTIVEIWLDESGWRL